MRLGYLFGFGGALFFLLLEELFLHSTSHFCATCAIIAGRQVALTCASCCSGCCCHPCSFLQTPPAGVAPQETARASTALCPPAPQPLSPELHPGGLLLALLHLLPHAGPRQGPPTSTDQPRPRPQRPPTLAGHTDHHAVRRCPDGGWVVHACAVSIGAPPALIHCAIPDVCPTVVVMTPGSGPC